jgi:hypothetical protein
MRPLLILPALILFACNTETDPAPDGATKEETPRKEQQVNERDSWQRPEELIALIGPQLAGSTVADLFAGDGYFTFRLLEAGANVIAVDNDPANIALLEARKKELGLNDARLQIRAVPVGDPGIRAGEADMALLVHRFGSIKDKGAYITQLREGLRYPRPLFLIDWQYRETPVGPPLAQRRMSDAIMEDLGALGYSDVAAHGAKMPYQIIFVATDYYEMDADTYDKMMEGMEVVPQ